MSDTGDDFRAMKDHRKLRQQDRETKFAQAFNWIRRDADAIGVKVTNSLSHWTFADDDRIFDWWPGSGKTSMGQHFSGWPEIKAHILASREVTP